MIVTRLIGGLGNQMFQYAFGLHLATQTKQSLYVDTSGFETYRLHALAINHFAISASQLPKSHRRRLPGRYRGTSRIREITDNLWGLIQPETASLKLRREKPFGYQPHYTSPTTNLYLDGYWQGEDFFPKMRAKLREEFTLAQPLTPRSRDVAAQIVQQESIAVHVRRGDYVTNDKTKKIYRNLDADYYRKCLTDIQQHIENPKVFLFSNDIDWCLKNLDVGLPVTPVTHNNAATAYEDLCLISQCRHAVIANSTFSWWGAFLARESAARRVYYPDPWFHPETLNGSALGCSDWIAERSLPQPSGKQAA